MGLWSSKDESSGLQSQPADQSDRALGSSIDESSDHQSQPADQSDPALGSSIDESSDRQSQPADQREPALRSSKDESIDHQSQPADQRDPALRSSKDESSDRQSQPADQREPALSDGAAMEAASEEESKDKYLPPDMADVDSDHYYSTNAPHPDLVRACEDDDVEQIRQTVNIGTPTEPVIRPDLLKQVPEPYFYVWDDSRIPMTIMALLMLAACYYGSIHCVQFLLWCDPSLLHGKVMFNVYKPRQNCSPASLLQVCAAHGHKALCELLMRKGIAVNVQDRWGGTPFHLAASGGHVSVLECLLNAGHPFEAKDSEGDTPLHDAAYYGHVSVVECLLTSGHSLEPKNNRRRTPLHWAASRGHVSVAEYLLNSGHSLEPKTDRKMLWCTQESTIWGLLGG
ncbi:poly [ADP-ribose] polymerase tankyrase-like [Sycon ciliatum]|uniref:poly [ADP-ribose] polymerase tankyrase-like n=1 Tax=Sycon ciliatum TaxID=27933 RepID=UPI0031F68578